MRTKTGWFVGEADISYITYIAQEYWSGQPIPSPADLPDPGIEPRSPALLVDSSATELSGKDITYSYTIYIYTHTHTAYYIIHICIYNNYN